MNYSKLYSAIAEEFSPKIALMVLQIVTISMTTKIPKDLNLASKVEKKARKLLWEESRADIELALKIFECVHSWDTRQSLQGLGGCVTKTFKELMSDGIQSSSI